MCAQEVGEQTETTAVTALGLLKISAKFEICTPPLRIEKARRKRRRGRPSNEKSKSVRGKVCMCLVWTTCKRGIALACGVVHIGSAEKISHNDHPPTSCCCRLNSTHAAKAFVARKSDRKNLLCGAGTCKIWLAGANGSRWLWWTLRIVLSIVHALLLSLLRHLP